MYGSPTALIVPCVWCISSQKRDVVSKKMGAKMLGGWTMLAKTCANPDCRDTPLMAKTGQPPMCVSCDGDGSAPKSAAPADKPADKPAVETRSLSSLSAGHVFAAPDGRKKSDFEVASGCVSARLLEGWTLLAESCDDCNTPLMCSVKHRDGEPACVNTRCYGKTEPVKPATDISMANVRSGSWDSDDALLEGAGYAAAEAAYAKERFGGRTASAAPAPAPAVAADGVIDGVTGGSVTMGAARRTALAAVARKMDAARCEALT